MRSAVIQIRRRDTRARAAYPIEPAMRPRARAELVKPSQSGRASSEKWDGSSTLVRGAVTSEEIATTMKSFCTQATA